MPTDPKALLAKYQPKAARPVNLDQQLCALRFSPDGKVLTRTVKGTNASGQQVDGVSVLERQ